MIRIVVPGPPPRKNRADRLTVDKRTGKPRRIKSKRAKAWRDELYFAMGRTMQSVVPKYLPKRGRWSLRLDIYEAEQRHLDVDVPHGDVDSTISAVLDALQPTRTLWGILDDDARVVEVHARKHYDKYSPRVEIMLEEITDG